MFLRTLVQKKGDKEYRYLKVVENYRDAGKTRQRTVLNMGNITEWSEARIRTVIRLLQCAVGDDVGAEAKDIRVVSSVSYGPGLALGKLWRSIGMPDIIAKSLSRRHPDFDVAAVIEAMAVNRLVEPKSKLGACEWISRSFCEGVGIGGKLAVQHLYRALDYLCEAKQEIEESIYARVSDLFTLDVSVVFYDVTSSYFEGGHCPSAKLGYSRDHRRDLLQIEIGLVVNPDGIPICHEVLEGNLNDMVTVAGVVKALKERFRISRVIFVGDAWMLGPDSVKALDNAGYEYILGCKPRHDNALASVVESMGKRKDDFEMVKDNLWVAEAGCEGGKRLVCCYNPVRAEAERAQREAKITACEQYLAMFAQPRKLGQKKRADLVNAQVARYLERKHLTRFFDYEYRGNCEFSLSRREDVLSMEKKLDGMLIVETTSSLPPREIGNAYRTRCEVERSFRSIKNFVRIRPIRHYNDFRVKAHVAVCVLAHLMERLFEQRLERAGLKMTAQAALEDLKSISLTTLELRGEIVRRPVEPSRSQIRVLNAIGIDHLPQILV